MWWQSTKIVILLFIYEFFQSMFDLKYIILKALSA